MADVVAEVKVTDASAEIEKEAPVEKEKAVEKEAPQEKVVENGTPESETTKDDVKEEESEAKESEVKQNGAKVNGDATKEESCPVLKRKSEGAVTEAEAVAASETDGVSPQKKAKLDESQNGASETAEATA